MCRKYVYTVQKTYKKYSKKHAKIEMIIHYCTKQTTYYDKPTYIIGRSIMP